MFDIKGHKALIKDLHKVVNNRLVLFNDGENDIIYTGTNPYGNRLLCCIMFDDDEQEFLRYSHILITENQYTDFLNRNISLLQILKANESLIVVDYRYDLSELDYNIVAFDDIPNEFIPLENSFCPEFIYEPSFNYSVSMQGGTADDHKISAQELNSVSNSFSGFLKSATTFIHELDLNREVYVEALEAGSFRINFKVELMEPEQVHLWDLPNANINSFLNDYFSYVFNDLPNEDILVFQHEEVGSQNFKQLEDKLHNLYESKGAVPPGGVEQKLIDLINYSVENLKSIEYNKGFDKVQFLNITHTGQEIPFASIDNDLISTIDDRLFNIDEFKAEDIITHDDKQTNYVLQVFQFNIDTGNGKAYYTQENGGIVKISVYARGRDNYQSTSFTKSMDENVPYNFMGIGLYKNGILKNITIHLD